MQGTLFWALFVIGHDCGHGSFSRHRWLNHLVGHLSHTPILVSFHGWRISHRTHHANSRLRLLLSAEPGGQRHGEGIGGIIGARNTV